jgi:hypothetical protein
MIVQKLKKTNSIPKSHIFGQLKNLTIEIFTLLQTRSPCRQPDVQSCDNG